MTHEIDDDDNLVGHISVTCLNCSTIHDLDDNATNLLDEQEGKKNV
jgi:hypothetical protein